MGQKTRSTKEKQIRVWWKGEILMRTPTADRMGNHVIITVKIENKERIIDTEFPYDIFGKKTYVTNKEKNLGYPLWMD
jgi:hypothetical protein